MKKNSLFIKLSLAGAVASIGIHIYLTLLHYALKYNTSSDPAICSVSDKFNCEAVAISSYSSFLGAPISLWGAIFNGVLALLLVHFLLNPQVKPFFRWAFSLTLGSVIASLIMGVISMKALNTYCLFCIALYAISILIAAFLFLAEDKRLIGFQDIKSLFSNGEDSLRLVLIYLVTIPALTFLIQDMVRKQQASGIERMVKSSLSEWSENASSDIQLQPGLVLGASNEKARFTIVEYADFQCIHCKMAAPTLHAFTLSRPDVQLNYQFFPLDGQCNESITRPGNGRSCLLAKAVYCAEKQQHGWDAHKWLFQNFGKPKVGDLEQLSKDIHIPNTTEFLSCVESEEAQELVVRHTQEAKRHNIDGTPTIFVNGKKLPGGYFLPILEAAYEDL